MLNPFGVRVYLLHLPRVAPGVINVKPRWGGIQKNFFQKRIHIFILSRGTGCFHLAFLLIYIAYGKKTLTIYMLKIALYRSPVIRGTKTQKSLCGIMHKNKKHESQCLRVFRFRFYAKLFFTVTFTVVFI